MEALLNQYLIHDITNLILKEVERQKFDEVMKEVNNIEYKDESRFSISYRNKDGIKIEMRIDYYIEGGDEDINGDRVYLAYRCLDVSNNDVFITLNHLEGCESCDIEIGCEKEYVEGGPDYDFLYYDSKSECFEEFRGLLKKWRHMLV